MHPGGHGGGTLQSVPGQSQQTSGVAVSVGMPPVGLGVAVMPPGIVGVAVIPPGIVGVLLGVAVRVPPGLAVGVRVGPSCVTSWTTPREKLLGPCVAVGPTEGVGVGVGIVP